MRAAGLLTIEQAREAYRIGVERNSSANGRGSRHRFGYSPAPVDERNGHGMAAVSEALVAAALGRPWTSQGAVPDPPAAGDVAGVAGGISVRWTPLEVGSLIIHEDEREELDAVLVVGPMFPRLTIAGWIAVWDAKRPEFWRSEGVRHAAYFVPQSALHAIELLRAGRG